jgi:hypothetical protein
MRRSSLATGPFGVNYPTERSFSPPPLASLNLPSLDDPLPPSPNAFGVAIWVTIERTAPNMSVPTAVSLPLATRFPLVSLSNATFAVDGDIPPAFVLPGCVQYVIDTDMCRATVRLRRFLLNRLPVSLMRPPPSHPDHPRGVLIEPGARLYEGGNVTVFLLFHHILLFSFTRRTHMFLGMFRNDSVHYLLIGDAINPSLILL